MTSWVLDIAIYEYELQAVVHAVNAAFERGVNFRVPVSRSTGRMMTHHHQRGEPGKNSRQRTNAARDTHNIFHNKFMVLTPARRGGAASTRSGALRQHQFHAQRRLPPGPTCCMWLDDTRVSTSYLHTFEQVILLTLPDVGGTPETGSRKTTRSIPCSRCSPVSHRARAEGICKRSSRSSTPRKRTCCSSPRSPCPTTS